MIKKPSKWLAVVICLSLMIIATAASVFLSNSSVLALDPTPTPTPVATPTPAVTPTPTPTPMPTATPTPTPGFYLKVNFQPSITPTPPPVYTCTVPYVIDSGYLYGPRYGYTYGWNITHTTQVYKRNKNTDYRLDTLCSYRAGGIWEAAVPMAPDNTYEVTVCVGDPTASTTNTINVEGVNYWTNLGLRPNEFRKYTYTVTVTDGRVTIDNGASPNGTTRINYVHIKQVHTGGPTNTPTPVSTGDT